ncbi:MAG: sulfate adenylyltransferase subunit 2 [Archangium sp.]|nr:sulfate adenylyltransferase subunit 2 [Archangium sp.]
MSLEWLEAEGVFLIREAVATCARPVLLFSGGKDSAVMLRLAEKAFWPGRIPFPVMHVDTGHNFPEAITFRDQRCAELGVELIVASVQDSIDQGRVADAKSRNPLQTVTLLDAISRFGFDAVFGGARRDEERSRAKERLFSVRVNGKWDPSKQRPELSGLINPHLDAGAHFRVFPLSNWTETDVWRFIAQEKMALPSIYYAHERRVFRRDGLWYAETPFLRAEAGEVVETKRVRFRTVGDATCTAAVESNAATIDEVLDELKDSKVSERGATRADDRASDAAMERRKLEGYF